LECVVRVNEQTVLIDAVKDLLSHVYSTAEKTTIDDVVNYFSRQADRTRDKSVVTAAANSETGSADDKMVLNIAENTAIDDACSAGQRTGVKDCTANSSCRDEEIGVAVAVDDASRSMNDAVEVECNWKLLIKVPSRTKHVPHRYGLPSQIIGRCVRFSALPHMHTRSLSV